MTMTPKDSRKWAGYRVVPMFPGLETAADALGRAFCLGLEAAPDASRTDFYSADVDDIACYFHVFEARRTAYLLSAEPIDAPMPADAPLAVPCQAC